MRAAVSRDLNPSERVPPEVALSLFLGAPTDPATPRRVAVGAPADLVLLHVPLATQLGELDPANVAATFIAGEPTRS